MSLVTAMKRVSSMSDRHLPWFKFFARDFLADQNVILMTPAERGLYITLQCSFWLAGSIPTDPTMLARLCQTSSDEFLMLWPAVEPYFEERNGRLFHRELDMQRKGAIEAWQAKSAGGRKGAERRWGKVEIG